MAGHRPHRFCELRKLSDSAGYERPSNFLELLLIGESRRWIQKVTPLRTTYSNNRKK